MKLVLSKLAESAKAYVAALVPALLIAAIEVAEKTFGFDIGSAAKMAKTLKQSLLLQVQEQ